MFWQQKDLGNLARSDCDLLFVPGGIYLGDFRPLSLMRLMVMSGDLLQNMGWAKSPITYSRLNNMLAGSHYPIEKTETVVGKLP